MTIATDLVTAAEQLEAAAEGVLIETAPYTPSWSGAAPRILQARLMDQVHVGDFGVRPNTDNDYTDELQRALNAATNNPGLDVVIPPGRYIHSGLTLGVDGDTTRGYARLIAAGARATDTSSGVILLCATADADHLTCYDPQGVTIDGISFSMAPGVTPTAGAAVRVMRGQRFGLNNFRIDGCWNGVDIFASRALAVRNGDILNLSGTIGLSMTADVTRNISRAVLQDLLISPEQAGAGSLTCDGLLIGDYVNSVYTYGAVQITWARRGLIVGQGGADRPAFCRFNWLGIENAYEDGIVLNNFTHLWFDEIYDCLCGGNGMTIKSTADAYGGAIWFDKGRVSANAGHGISGEGRASVHLGKLRCGSSSTPKGNPGGIGNTKDGINISASEFYLYADTSRFGGNVRELDTDTATYQRFGLRLEPTLLAGLIQMDLTTLSGNVSSALSDEAGPAVVRQFGENNVATGEIVSNRPTGRRNRLHNGSFEIWQRGTSIAISGASHGGTADRWTLTCGSSQPSTVTRVAGLSDRSQYAARVQRNAGNTATTTSFFEQAFSAEQVAAMRGAMLTVSWLSRFGPDFSPTTLNARVAFGTGVPGRKGNGSYTNQTTGGIGLQSGASFAISAITNANPGVVTAIGHSFASGDRIVIKGVGGMTALNGKVFRIAKIDADTFSLDSTDTTGYGAYTSGGTAYHWPMVLPQAITGISQANPGVVTCPGHGMRPGRPCLIENVSGMTDVNGKRFTVTVIDDNSFSIGVDTTGYGAYTSGGTASYVGRYSASASFVVPTNATQGCLQFFWTASGTAGAADWFEIDDVQLEFGWQPTQYERRPFHSELADCKRFYRKSFAYDTTPAQNAGTTGAHLMQLPTGASGSFGGFIRFDEPMAAAPTVTTFNPSATNADWRDATNSADRTATVAGQADSGFEVTGASGVAGSANRIHWTADCGYT